MVNYFIYATDDSASTRGQDYFNTKGLKTLKSFNDEVKVLQNSAESSAEDHRVVYLHWSHRCVKVEEDEVISRYRQKSGIGRATLPHTVLDWIAENVTDNDTMQLLYLVTDGAVDRFGLKACDPKMKIQNVTFHALNHNVNDIDMSVASMFICNNKSYSVYCNEKLVDNIDLSNPFDYDQITLENFHEKKEELKSYIKLQFLTKSSSDLMALEEIKKLKCLQTHLCSKIPSNEDKPAGPINLNVKDKESFIQQFKNSTFYKTMMNPHTYDEKQNISSCINTLVNYINNDKRSFRFDNLKFTQKFTPQTEEEEVFNVNYQDVEEITFPDIIMANETGVPVILLTNYNLMDKILMKPDQKISVGSERYKSRNTRVCKGKRSRANRLCQASGLNRKSHFSRFRKVVDCPLILLNDPNFKNSIEYYYNLDAFKSMIEHGIQTGPRTRQQFTGAIVPLEEFDDYNDYILTCTYFDKRRVPYNKGLFYYVLYKTCEKLEYIEPNVVNYLKEYVIKRIAKTKCFLSLSRTTIDDPSIRVDLTTALWYCVELSSTIFKDDPKHFQKEKMRLYSCYAEHMKEILRWFQYDVDTESVDLRAGIFRHVNRLKRISRPADKALFILKQIFKKRDWFLVAELVNPENIYKLNYLKMDHKKVIDESVLSAEVDLHQFAHFMDYVETTDVPVCKHTMRPHFVTEDKKSFYEHLKTNARQVCIQNNKLTLAPVDRLDFTRILSVNNLYISYVKQYKKFPTLNKYKRFILQEKYCIKKKPVVFATNTLALIENTFAAYDKIIKATDDPIDVAKFIEITKSSVNREDRIKREKPINFNMDDIPSYIKHLENNIICDKGIKEELKSTSPSGLPSGRQNSRRKIFKSKK